MAMASLHSLGVSGTDPRKVLSLDWSMEESLRVTNLSTFLSSEG